MKILKPKLINNSYDLIKKSLIDNLSIRSKRFSVADFETTANKEKPEVYSWGLLNEKLQYKDGISIDSFLSELEKTTAPKLIFFQNGSKFDLHFLLPVLSKKFKAHYAFNSNIKVIQQDLLIYFRNKLLDYAQGFNKVNKIFYEVYLNELQDEEYQDFWLDDIKYMVRTHSGLSSYMCGNKLDIHEYSYFTDENHKIYEIKFMNSKGNKIIIRDAMLIFGGSLKQKGEVLNKIYNTNLLSKDNLESNYQKLTKYTDYNSFKNDKNEREYLFKDNLILLLFLINMKSYLPFKHWKLTYSSTAYYNWKYKFFGEYLYSIYNKKGLIEKKQSKNGITNYRLSGESYFGGLKYLKNKLVEKVLPVNNDLYGNEIIKWFWGGLTWGNPDTMGLLLYKLSKIDINSSYSGSMLKELPYGEVYVGDKKGYNFKYYEITAISDLYNNKGLPFIKVSNQYGYKPYSKKIPAGTIIRICSIEFERFKKYYIGEIKIKILYSQKTISGKIVFGDFINKWYNIKKTNKNENPLLTSIAKLMLNSCYGKFGSKRIKTSRIWINDKWETIEQVLDLEFYLPFGIAITAHSRMKLVDIIGYNNEVIIGGDTDSIIIPSKFLKNLKPYLNKTELGMWDIEQVDMWGIFRRKKQYMYKYKIENETKYSIAFASIDLRNFDLSKISWKEFVSFKIIPEQLRPNRLPTGIYLENYDKEIKPVWDKNYLKTDDMLNLWYSDKNSFYNNYTEQLNKINERINNYEWK